MALIESESAINAPFMTRWDEMCAEHPLPFHHVDETVLDLRKRVETLKNELKDRYELLRWLSNPQLKTADSVSRQVGGGIGSETLRRRADDFGHLRGQSLRVICEGSNYPRSSLLVAADAMCAFSNVMAEKVRSLNQPDGNTYTVVLREKDPPFNCGIENILHPKMMEKAILFAEDPHLVEKEFTLRHALASVRKGIEESTGALLSQIFEEKESCVGKMEEIRHKEVEELLAEADESFNRNMRCFFEAHAMHKRQLQQSVDEKFVSVEQEIGVYFDEQVKLVESMRKRLLRDTCGSTESSWTMARADMQRVFNPSTVPTLLLLSETLDSEDLRSGCIDHIAQNISGHMHHPAFENKRLSERSLSRILSLISLDQLVQLSKEDQTTLSKVMVIRELDFRKKLYRAHLEEMTILELRRLQAEQTTQFPALIADEISKRKTSSVPYVKLDADTASVSLSVSERTAVVNCKVPRVYGSVDASHGKDQSMVAHFYYEATAIFSDPTCSIAIGLDSKATTRRIHGRPGLSAAEQDDPRSEVSLGITWQNDGTLCCFGELVSISHSFQTGDVVGVYLNQVEGTVTFYCNGKCVGPNGTRGRKIPLDTYCLYPSACLYKTRESQECNVAFNFAGPFTWQQRPRFVESWGAFTPHNYLKKVAKTQILMQRIAQPAKEKQAEREQQEAEARQAAAAAENSVTLSGAWKPAAPPVQRRGTSTVSTASERASIDNPGLHPL